MARKRVLFISNLYPNTQFPSAAAFSRQQVEAIGEMADVDVIAPVPWRARLRGKIPQSCTLNGIEINHPIFFYPPGVLRSMYGHFYLNSIKNVAKALLEANNYDYILSSWLFPDSWAAAQIAGRYGKPLFVKIVGTDVNRLIPGTSLTAKSLSVIEKASGVIAVSMKLKEQLVSLGADSNKIKVIYNGVNRDIFHPLDKDLVRRKLDIPAGRKVVLFVGNLIREKGVLELAAAFGKVVCRNSSLDISLVVVGTGPYEKRMRNELNKNNAGNRVYFTGSISLENVSMWMNACDVLCLPTYREGQPNVVLEGLACQTNIIASHVGGIPELCDDKVNLRLIEPGSEAQLEEAINDILFGDKFQPQVSPFVNSWQDYAAKVLEFFERSSGHTTEAMCSCLEGT